MLPQKATREARHGTSRTTARASTICLATFVGAAIALPGLAGTLHAAEPVGISTESDLPTLDPPGMASNMVSNLASNRPSAANRCDFGNEE